MLTRRLVRRHFEPRRNISVSIGHQKHQSEESLVTLKHTTVLRCIPVLLGDKPSDFFKLCFDSDKNDFEHIAVGILTVINEDSPHSSSLIHADPVSTS
ncbi:hypothetical protein IRJ41_009372 [Triplophysa rosa]|uniref:Uncharacterized protein n=1 Tax=Triplophysa rosa TaxID=992332 RepID=A0A9W8C894_TRIRA|nr:hypothetical protein IRJ41_009372 [Triplophysa rosa]